MQKKIEELNKEKNYISDIINSMPSIIIGLNKEGEITRWNQRAEKSFNLKAEEALGQSVRDILDYISSDLDGYFRKGAPSDSVMTVRKTRQSGKRIIHEEISLYPLSDSLEGDSVLRIDDITEKVRFQEALVQSEKMLSIGGLAAGMAHEINNPLAGIIQTAEVMTKRLTDMSLDANRKAADDAGIDLETFRIYLEKRGIPRMLKAIWEGGQRASSIIHNMLSFSRLDHGPFSTHDPVEMLDNIIELASSDFDLKSHYDFREIEIIREYEANIPVIPCSRSQIQQVMLNLLKNGAEAMCEIRDKGYSPRFILRLRRDEDKLYIDVEDNGPGLSSEEKKHIFEPFFTTKPVGSGTGLGLSVSYFIITNNHKGTMEVHSRPGEGVCFTIGLPLHI
nr:ATP-binding protein [Spirochaeta isovalerica]